MKPMEFVKGLMVDVYRTPSHSCLFNEVTSIHESLLLVGEGVPEVTEGEMYVPVVKLVRRTLFDSEYLHAEPPYKQKYGWSFGGSFIYSLDDRFPSRYPIPVYDMAEPSRGKVTGMRLLPCENTGGADCKSVLIAFIQ